MTVVEPMKSRTQPKIAPYQKRWAICHFQIYATDYLTWTCKERTQGLPKFWLKIDV